MLLNMGIMSFKVHICTSNHAKAFQTNPLKISINLLLPPEISSSCLVAACIRILT